MYFWKLVNDVWFSHTRNIRLLPVVGWAPTWTLLGFLNDYIIKKVMHCRVYFIPMAFLRTALGGVKSWRRRPCLNVVSDFYLMWRDGLMLVMPILPRELDCGCEFVVLSEFVDVEPALLTLNPLLRSKDKFESYCLQEVFCWSTLLGIVYIPMYWS